MNMVFLILNCNGTRIPHYNIDQSYTTHLTAKENTEVVFSDLDTLQKRYPEVLDQIDRGIDKSQVIESLQRADVIVYNIPPKE